MVERNPGRVSFSRLPEAAAALIPCHFRHVEIGRASIIDEAPYLPHVMAGRFFQTPRSPRKGRIGEDQPSFQHVNLQR